MSSTSVDIVASPRKLKILMLHGYTQTGPLFHAKTRALEKALQKAIPATTSKAKPPPPGSLPSYPGGIQLVYPSGPRCLRPGDIPGYQSSIDDGDDNEEKTDPPDMRAWWQRNDTTGEYVGMDEGFNTIAETIHEVGGIDGVIGFSQGAAAAAMVASLLEPGRIEAFTENAESAVGGIAYPFAFLAKSGEGTAAPIQEALKFGCSYSGFQAPHPKYSSFYSPKIKTPMLHFIGSLDSVVEESRSLALADCSAEKRIVYHPGGHFVPIGKEMVGLLVGFIRDCCGEDSKTNENSKAGKDLDGIFANI